MTWLMPAEFVPFAGVLAVVFFWPRLRQPTSSVRFAGEVFTITVGTIMGCAGAWALTWWIEQRW
jgi:hypothetical protein